MEYKFGDVLVGSLSGVSFTLSNSGSSVISLNSLTISGADNGMFTVGDDTCGTSTKSIAAHGSCTVDILFAPTSVGAKSASFDIQSSDTERPLLPIALHGTGLPVTFTVLFNGNGAGQTSSDQDGLICLSSSTTPCQTTVVPGTWISITPIPDKDSLFSGWPVDCTISGSNTCKYFVLDNSSVTATFNYVLPARIVGTNNTNEYPSLKDAYAGATDGNVILARAFTFTGPLDFNNTIGVKLKGGYDLNYSSNSDFSVVKGKVTISKGKVIAERIIVLAGP